MPAGQRLVQLRDHAAGTAGSVRVPESPLRNRLDCSTGLTAATSSSSSSAVVTGAAVSEQKWVALYQGIDAAGRTTAIVGAGELAEPTGLAVLDVGALVVTDCTTNRTYLFDPLIDEPSAVHSRDYDLNRPYSVIAVPTAVTSTVNVEPYDPHWPARFSHIKRNAMAALKGVTTRIEHVGSTSVSGLAAKPVIDVDVVVATTSELKAAIDALRPLGYVHRGELGIAGRHAFKYMGPPDGGGKRNFYVCLQGSDSLLNHLILRDYLRSHPEAAAEYSAVKLENARKFSRNIDGYVEAKTRLIVQFLAAAGFDPLALSAIVEANKQNDPTVAPEMVENGSERLLVTDRNHHQLVEMDPAANCKFVRAVGSEGTGLGEFNGPRSIALLHLGTEKCHGGLARPILAVVENENDRIQLLRWDETVMATVQLEDGQSGEFMSLKGAGGCAALSSVWRQPEDQGSLPQLLAVADSYNHRVLVVEIHLASSSDNVAVGRVLWKFLGVANGGGIDGGSTSFSSFAVPTCVCEPRPGLLAVTDRENGRLVLIELSTSLQTGANLSQVVASRAVDMAFNAPVGCCKLPGGGVAVADTGNSRVVILPPRALA